MNIVNYALEVAKEYYDENTYKHAVRVAGYVDENKMIQNDIIIDCISLALMHDLLEDTEYKGIELDKHFKECLDLLTKPKQMNYIEYIKNIKKHNISHPEAYWVKLADMKDHFAQKETLTDRLKEKYISALPYLL